MTNREFCLSKRKAEIPAFVRVLKALPADRLDHRPDPRSRTARELAYLLSSEEAGLIQLIDTGSVEWKEGAPANVGKDEIVQAFERDAAAVNERLGRLSEAAWEKKVKFVMTNGGVWEDTLAEFVWGFLFDAIHHRGQLSTYIRPMGGKVPSIYGPSADDTGQ
jgi:uncharacterized damage-inducible protein DinB